MDPLAASDDGHAWTQAAEVVDLVLPGLIDAFRDMLFGMTPEAWLETATASPEAMLDWAKAHSSAFRRRVMLVHVAGARPPLGRRRLRAPPAAPVIMDELGSRMLSNRALPRAAATAPAAPHRGRSPAWSTPRSSARSRAADPTP